MAWNYLVGGLLHGATTVLYDGSPGYPGQGELWSIADATEATVMGTGSAYVSACQKTGVDLTLTPGGAADDDPDRLAASAERLGLAPETTVADNADRLHLRRH